MTENQAGRTAVAIAYSRAYHATHNSPRIFDDFLANSLFTPEERAQTEAELLSSEDDRDRSFW